MYPRRTHKALHFGLCRVGRRGGCGFDRMWDTLRVEEERGLRLLRRRVGYALRIGRAVAEFEQQIFNVYPGRGGRRDAAPCACDFFAPDIEQASALIEQRVLNGLLPQHIFISLA